MHRFTTTTPPRLTIQFRAGDISIDTHEGDETTVDLRARSNDDAARALVEETLVEQRGENIVVVVPKRSQGLFGNAPELSLAITAPHGTRLNVKTASADLAARGTYGESRVASGSGDVSLESLTGEAHLRSGSGDMTVDTTTAELSVGSGSGDVRVGSAAGALTVQSGSGDLVVTTATGPLKVQTGSGDIEVDEAADEVKAQTGSGDVALKRVSRGRVQVKAASGDLHVGVADGIPAWLDVRTVTGGVDSDLDATEPVGAGEDYVRLDLKTVSGDIEITRA